jgi:hypothetical protein
MLDYPVCLKASRASSVFRMSTRETLPSRERAPCLASPFSRCLTKPMTDIARHLFLLTMPVAFSLLTMPLAQAAQATMLHLSCDLSREVYKDHVNDGAFYDQVIAVTMSR